MRHSAGAVKGRCGGNFDGSGARDGTLPLHRLRGMVGDLCTITGPPDAPAHPDLEDLKTAMKAKDQLRLSTLRLINAAIKDRDIALRGQGEDREMSEGEITSVLSRMVKQRQESARAYEEGGRLELVERELAEIAVIEDYLPRQLSDEEVEAAIAEAITELEANSIRDMGRVMNALKAKYTGQMDFGAIGPVVKARLSGGA